MEGLRQGRARSEPMVRVAAAPPNPPPHPPIRHASAEGRPELQALLWGAGGGGLRCFHSRGLVARTGSLRAGHGPHALPLQGRGRSRLHSQPHAFPGPGHMAKATDVSLCRGDGPAHTEPPPLDADRGGDRTVMATGSHHKPSNQPLPLLPAPEMPRSPCRWGVWQR